MVVYRHIKHIFYHDGCGEPKQPGNRFHWSVIIATCWLFPIHVEKKHARQVGKHFTNVRFLVGQKFQQTTLWNHTPRIPLNYHTFAACLIPPPKKRDPIHSWSVKGTDPEQVTSLNGTSSWSPLTGFSASRCLGRCGARITCQSWQTGLVPSKLLRYDDAWCRVVAATRLWRWQSLSLSWSTLGPETSCLKFVAGKLGNWKIAAARSWEKNSFRQKKMKSHIWTRFKLFIKHITNQWNQFKNKLQYLKKYFLIDSDPGMKTSKAHQKTMGPTSRSSSKIPKK